MERISSKSGGTYRGHLLAVPLTKAYTAHPIVAINLSPSGPKVSGCGEPVMWFQISTFSAWFLGVKAAW